MGHISMRISESILKAGDDEPTRQCASSAMPIVTEACILSTQIY